QRRAADDALVDGAVGRFTATGAGLFRRSLAGRSSRQAALRRLQVELAADGQDSVADWLGFQPPLVHAPEQDVVRVNLVVGVDMAAGKLVGPSQDDAPDQFLGGPAVLDELRRQVVEQLGV